MYAGGQVAGGHLSIVVIISRQGVTASTTSHHHLHPLCAVINTWSAPPHAAILNNSHIGHN